MSRPQKKKRNRLLAAVTALAVLVVVILAIIVAVVLLRPGGPNIPGTGPGTSAAPSTPRPDAQDASCPDVQLVSVPGTWESSANDDPINPTSNPAALLLNVTNPLRSDFANDRVAMYTVPYTAQFSNPIALPPDGQMSYNDSRAQGMSRAMGVITDVHAKCPLTNFGFIGFSQGAVIAGDIASNIGAGLGPIGADQLIGVGLIADGRRDPSSATDVGPNPDGVGAEVALGGLRIPGISMTGKRPGGFGSVADRTQLLCAPGDLICSSPKDALNPLNLIGSVSALVGALGSPVHAMYNTPTYWQLDGQTATQWLTEWMRGRIAEAPHPAHK